MFVVALVSTHMHAILTHGTFCANSCQVGIFTGVPKQLSGVSRIVQMMDWQSETGEENEGMVGEYVRFGGVGPKHVINEEKDADGNVVQHQDDVFIIIAPQVRPAQTP
jgi:adenylate kinase